jgi:magnesium transporter
VNDLEQLANHIRMHLEQEPEGIPPHLEDLLPADAADLLNRLSVAEAAKVLSLLPLPRAVAVCNQKMLRRRGAIFEQFDPNLAAQIVEKLSADERADVLGAMSPYERRRLLPVLPAPLQAEVEKLLQYPPHTAGGIMTTQFVTFTPEMTVEQALAQIRTTGRDHEHIYAAYVVAPATRAMVGVVSLRDLVVADPNRLIGDTMHPKPIYVQSADDRRKVAEKIGRYNLLAVPVLDENEKLVGSVTVDDVIDVMVEEQTEQMLRMGAVEPSALDEPYLQVGFWTMVKKRAGWLVILFLGEMLTATAMGYFEKEIEKAVVLALFVPLIISSGGNSGSQATTIVIRAMALQEVRLRDWWRIMRREVYSGLALGSVLGSIGFLRIALWSAFTPIYGPYWPLIGLTVALSLVGVVLWGTMSGSMLPLLLRRVGFDPAASSAPFVATLVDVTGLVIYFSVAVAVLRGTLL